MDISTPFYVDADQIGFLLKQVKEKSFEYPWGDSFCVSYLLLGFSTQIGKRKGVPDFRPGTPSGP
jgi:hypothetical protein